MLLSEPLTSLIKNSITRVNECQILFIPLLNPANQIKIEGSKTYTFGHDPCVLFLRPSGA